MDHYDRKLGVTGTERCKGQIGKGFFMPQQEL